MTLWKPTFGDKMHQPLPKQPATGNDKMHQSFFSPTHHVLLVKERLRHSAVAQGGLVRERLRLLVVTHGGPVRERLMHVVG